MLHYTNTLIPRQLQNKLNNIYKSYIIYFEVVVSRVYSGCLEGFYGGSTHKLGH